MAAQFEVVVRVVQDGKVLSEAKKSVEPNWNFEPPAVTSYAMLDLSDREIKANLLKHVVADLKDRVDDLTVDALLGLELALKAGGARIQMEELPETDD